jgi:hypothetical protein
MLIFGEKFSGDKMPLRRHEMGYTKFLSKDNFIRLKSTGIFKR